MQDTMTRTIDLGAVNRNLATGRFVKTYTLSYEMVSPVTGETLRVVRRLPAAGIEKVGRVVNHRGEMGRVWNIYVLDGGSGEYDAERDVTADFACFA